MSQLTDRQRAEKMKNMAMQEKYNAEGQKRFERDKQVVLDEAKEKVTAGIMKGGLTWKQMLDLPSKTFAGGTPYRHGIDPPIMEGAINRRNRIRMERSARMRTLNKKRRNSTSRR